MSIFSHSDLLESRYLRFIPHLDHLIPPDVPYAHYCECLDKKRKMIGK
jgi:hypothetical protein